MITHANAFPGDKPSSSAEGDLKLEENGDPEKSEAQEEESKTVKESTESKGNLHRRPVLNLSPPGETLSRKLEKPKSLKKRRQGKSSRK